MKPKKFKILLENMPDSIEVSGEEKQGLFHFESDIEIESENYLILTELKGNQHMKYSSGEDEVGLSDGWELNRDAKIYIETYGNLHVWKNETFIELTNKQEETLFKNIVKLIYLEL